MQIELNVDLRTCCVVQKDASGLLGAGGLGTGVGVSLYQYLLCYCHNLTDSMFTFPFDRLRLLRVLWLCQLQRVLVYLQVATVFLR